MLGLDFQKDILPFLSNLSTEFTKYLASDLIGVTSTHAIRLYELLMQYRSLGKREIEIDKLRWMFELQNKYPVWADFKKRVLDQAVKEINEFSPLDVTYDTKRTGRKITSINLKFKQKPKQTQIATETPKREQTGQEPIKPPYRASNRKIQHDSVQIRQYFRLSWNNGLSNICKLAWKYI